MDILLTDDEMEEIIHDSLNAMYANDAQECRDIAKAQLKKVVGWGDEECSHTIPSYLRFKRECPECRQDLKKEAGV